MADINLQVWVPRRPWICGTLILGNRKASVVGSQLHSDSLLTTSPREGSKPGSDTLPVLISIEMAAAWGEGFVKEEKEVTPPHPDMLAYKFLVWNSNTKRCWHLPCIWLRAHAYVCVHLCADAVYANRLAQYHLWPIWCLCAEQKLRARSCRTAGRQQCQPPPLHPHTPHPCVVSSSPLHSSLNLSVHCSVWKELTEVRESQQVGSGKESRRNAAQTETDALLERHTVKHRDGIWTKW